MKHSLSFYITLLVIKLKGLKKKFSQDPIDFKKIRKDDIHFPNKRLFKEYSFHNFKIANTTITEFKQNDSSGKIVLLIHGGAFISGPSEIHWNTIKEILKHTNHSVWMVDYPKAPENNILKISENIDKVYNKALENYSSKQIMLLGDSVGGTLITTLIQRLIQKSIDLPNKIILVSPVMDATLTNPAINDIDKTDPMLSRVGVLSAKKMCAINNNLQDEMISPLYGSFENFPSTILFLAQNDITFPDQKLAVEKMRAANIILEEIEGENMPHIWPFLPVMQEAKTALATIINRLNN